MASRSVSSVNVEIPGGNTGTIIGTVDLPGDVAGLAPEEFRAAGVPVALFAHCFTCNRNVPAAFRISKTLARHGIASLRIDFSSLLFSGNIADLETAASWLDDRLAAPDLLVGHSLGGAAVLQVAHRITSVRAMATIGAQMRQASAAKTLLDT
ncbi:MAG TPA: alpha/beta hydrolase, partial [Candidatus Corynebacterium avicola]|nr:alpha/beta hydrolase [Candidatus Corynebacterium avicola]